MNATATTTDTPQPTAQHTPGPWEYSRMRLPDSETDRRCGFVVNGPDTNPDDLPTRVCDLRVPQGFSGFAEGEANARLIAAAPDLLAALQKLTLSVGVGLIAQNVTHGPTYDALKAARAAIRKATK